MTPPRPRFALGFAALAGGLAALLHGGLLVLGGGVASGQARPWILAATAVLAAATEAGFASNVAADEASVPAARARAYGWLSMAGALLLLVLTAGPLVDWSHLSGARPAGPGWSGLAVMLAALGIVLRALAIRRLGARFSSRNTVAREAALETGGVYRWLAHPSEAGLLCLGGGVALLAASPWSLAALAALYASGLARIAVEEATLRDRHGDQYKSYRARRLDPFPSWPKGF